MSLPTSPEAAAAAVERFLTVGMATKLVVQSHYGDVVLPISELWFDQETRTAHVSVLIPAGYDLVKKPT